MAKSRRNVQFPRRSSTAHERPSFGDHDAPSAPTSPVRAYANGKNRDEAVSEEEVVDAPPSEYEKKKQTFITRTIWTLIMIGGFFVALFSGHIYIIMLITAIQLISFKEVIAIANIPSKAKNLRFTKSLNWYFLGTAMYYLYGESVIYYFKHIVLVDKVLLPFATHHRFIGFMLYVIGFVFFVLSLKKGQYRFQFTQFAWTHMGLLLIVGQAHFVMNNIFEGMFWFFVPAALVIVNDIFAYICGITFGRTQLIALSPKKTVEGFAGAWVFTLLFGIVFTHFLTKSSYFICPVNDLGANIFTGLNCRPNPVFVPHPYAISFADLATFVAEPPPAALQPLLTFERTFWIKPIQFHVLTLATFASLIAPFGGFFASGLKRFAKIKDFGESIPGHGGITDRFDCQFIMGFFTFMYYQSFIAEYQASVGDVLEAAVQGLTGDDQIEVLLGLTQHLINQGLLAEKAADCLSALSKG